MSYQPPHGGPPQGYGSPGGPQGYGPPGGYGPPPGGGYGQPGGPGGYGPPGGGAPPPQKKKGNGCMIALIVVGVLFLATVGGLAFFFYRVSQDPNVKQAFEAAGDAIELMQEAQNAEGMEELRDEGCDQALLLDMEKILDIAEKHAKDGDFERPDSELRSVVVCNTKKSLDCDEVAETYVDAADPSDGFIVIVQRPGSGEPRCRERFDEKGKSQGEFEGNVPVPQVPE